MLVGRLAQAHGDRFGAGLRSVSAWALPRPSAIASAKLANSTVNQSQSADLAGEGRVPQRAAEEIAEEDRSSVAADTISTTNMTGLRISVRGSSLRNDVENRRRGASAGSKIEDLAFWTWT